MSWYIQRLFLDSEMIRDNIYNTYYDGKAIGLEDNPYQVVDLSDDTYLDLLEAETKLDFLRKNGQISEDEWQAFNLMVTNLPIRTLEKMSGISRPTILKRFEAVCSRVAYHLGGHFTNLGYINYMMEKYNLNEEQIKILKKEMNINEDT